MKVRGFPPKVSSDVLVPLEWIQLANKNWEQKRDNGFVTNKPLRLGVDIAGMGTDSTCFCLRYGSIVKEFRFLKSAAASHMEAAGNIITILRGNTSSTRKPKAFIDTIGEGASVYSRLVEQGMKDVYSCKFSEAAQAGTKTLKDKTGQYEFLNMRAYLYWCIRDWLNPAHGADAALPDDKELTQELMQTKWEFMSNGRIKIESKDEIKKRIKRSPDRADSLANTFWPVEDYDFKSERLMRNVLSGFH